MTRTVNILAIAGSLRVRSYNRAALRAAQELAPDRARVEIFNLDEIPMFNQDLEAELPATVRQMKKRILAADAILFATPEYNYSIPGVLKNSMDWCSRPYGQSAWTGKPVAVIGATEGAFGTTRAQLALRQILVTLDMPVVNQPEVLIANAAAQFDADGRLTNEKTRELIGQLLVSLVELSGKRTG